MNYTDHNGRQVPIKKRKGKGSLPEPLEVSLARARKRPGRTKPGDKAERLAPCREEAALALAAWMFRTGTGPHTPASQQRYQRVCNSLHKMRCEKERIAEGRHLMDAMSKAKENYLKAAKSIGMVTKFEPLKRLAPTQLLKDVIAEMQAHEQAL